MKKMFALLLSASILMSAGLQGVVSAAPASKFTDISGEKYAWAKQYIETMAAEGYINGYEDNTYRPDNEVTRLETIVLFARAMGSNRTENKKVLENALSKYGSTAKNLKLNFGTDEIAFMLYRGALDEADLGRYLTAGKANQAMPRQEASAIITKAMCAEDQANAEVLIDMDYTDAKSISSDYSQYVFYVSENGIMNGMEDGSFSPKTSVLRSQIAAMLYRVVDKMNLYIEETFVSALDTEKNNITIDSDGEVIPMGYTDYTKFFIDGRLSEEKYMQANSISRITYINNEIVFVDMLETVSGEKEKGVYQGAVTKDGDTIVTIKDASTNKTTEYELSKHAVFYDGTGALVTDNPVKPGNYVEFETVNKRITSISIIKKDHTIEGAKIEQIGIEDELYIVVSHDNPLYDGVKYILKDSVLVVKNGDVEDLSKLYKGDNVDITLEYDEVKSISATSDKKIYEGVISEVVISKTPVLKIKIDGKVEDYDILPEISIFVDEEEATVYDLRVGDTVKITVESGVVLSIATVEAVISSNSMTGIIEVVNTSKGFIKISGETVFCKDETTTFISAKGSDMVMKDLKEGMTVSVRGSVSNGAYTASLIIIED